MMLLYGIAAAALLWWLTKAFVHSDTAVVAKALKVVAGVVALGAAAVLGLRGRIDMALLLGGFAAWALGWSGLKLPGIWRRTQGAAGRFSRIRSAMIEMEIDHTTGALGGMVLAGAYAGRSLSDLDQTGLRRVYDECRAFDPEGVALLEAYLDRRFAGWREHAQGDRDPRSRARAQPGAMSKEEAYQILGLQPGASVDEIRQAYRTLMKKLHPDQGGTAHLAARVNEAREILLSRHR
ncbi:DnaJ domain-containing protein [Microvirga sp. 2TAF3]|uniref:DnaJ domain-containing protein n=1 Tax=Microvirga sp. 2TAF3 TaxID=3233014 RepID=UPI003F9490DF